MTHHQNRLKAWRFEHPDWIPCTVSIPDQSWLTYDRKDLAWLIRRHPAIVGDLDPDRQRITAFGSSQECRELIGEEIEKLSTPAGGLSLCYEVRAAI